MKTGIELIAEERQRQIDVEGYTSALDADHDGGELAFAAAIYATPTLLYEKRVYANEFRFMVADINWNLDYPLTGNVRLDNDKFPKKKRLRQLVKAGALIAAEIDRLQRTKI